MKRLLGTLTGLVALTVASTALAQEAPPTVRRPGAEGDGPGSIHDDMRRPLQARWREHAQAEAKALRDILNLHPEQDAALQAFMTAMAPKEPKEPEDKRAGPPPTLTTPERLDLMSRRMVERQADFQRRADAIRAFYAALSPDQQRAFDALRSLPPVAPPGPGGPGGPRHPGGFGPEG